MLTKLSLRNAKRSIKDYLIYLITMSGVAALMYAFDSVVFSKSITNMWKNAGIMATMIGLATVFIMVIVSWLINYMVRFMLEKRSKEFGTYLLLGMEQKEIAKLYMRENMIMGGSAFLIGIVVGFFLEQVLLVLFFQFFSKAYQVQVEFSFFGLGVAALCYAFCFLRAMRKSRKLFRKMTISDLMRMEKENEQIKGDKNRFLQVLFPIGIILLAGVYYAFGKLSFSGWLIAGCIAAFVAGIYCFYIGLASVLFSYLGKKRTGAYRKQNVFLLRQLASKLHTMRFTMGTISLLLCVALLGGSISMMFAKYQNRAVDNVMPFDIIVYNRDSDYRFEEERKIVAKDSKVEEEMVYNIYHTKNKEVIHYLAVHNASFSEEYLNPDGSFSAKKFEKNNWAYYDYDTYMLEGDYNKLRNMLGLSEISLGNQEFAIQAKPRVATYFNKDFKERTIGVGTEELQLSKIYTDDFSQNGHNGADFVIIVPDGMKENLTPYYSNYVVSLAEEPSDELSDKLAECIRNKKGMMSEDEYYDKIEKMERSGVSEEEIEAFEDKEELLVFAGISIEASGSDQIISLAGDVLVRKTERKEALFAVTSIIFPTVYIGLVFLCIALTILAVQQMSDSGKYRFRYDVLRKLGLSERQIDGVVIKQLLIYYMIPALFAVLLSSGISIFMGNKFVEYTGASGNGLYYFGLSLIIFFVVYLLYFIATCVGFLRNIGMNKKLR